MAMQRITLQAQLHFGAHGGEIAARPSKNEVTYASIINAIKQVGEEIDEYIASVKEGNTNEE